MTNFILSDGTIPFTVAIGLLLALSLLEIISFVAGFALSGAIEAAMPDLDGDVDLDVDSGAATPGWGTQFLQWLHVGEAPTLILFMLFLLSFGSVGWALQWLTLTIVGGMLPWVVAIFPALFGAFGTVRVMGSFVRKVIPDVETSAVSADSLLGHVATVTLGTAKVGTPSQAKLQDRFGQTHYVLVEPLRAGEEFPHGSAVTLIQRDGPKYYVVEDSVDALLTLGDDSPSTENRQQA